MSVTFTEWEQTAETKKTIEVNRDIIRDIWPTPNGIDLMQDVCMPRHIFAQQREYTLVQYILPVSQRAAVEAAGGTLNTEDYYTEEGYGMALFTGEDSMEKAWHFSQTLSCRKVKHGS